MDGCYELKALYMQRCAIVHLNSCKIRMIEVGFTLAVRLKQIMGNFVLPLSENQDEVHLWKDQQCMNGLKEMSRSWETQGYC